MTVLTYDISADTDIGKIGRYRSNTQALASTKSQSALNLYERCNINTKANNTNQGGWRETKYFCFKMPRNIEIKAYVDLLNQVKEKAASLSGSLGQEVIKTSVQHRRRSSFENILFL